MKTICKENTCEFDKEICCMDCEAAGTCPEVCDGFNEEGMHAPCPWKEEE